MNKCCPICKSENQDIIKNYAGNSKIFSMRSIVECKDCSLAFMSPSLSDAELDNYNSQYFQNAHGGYSEHPLVLGFHSAINRSRVEYVLDYCKRKKITIKKVFEVGPGSGMFLKHFKDLNPIDEYAIVESDSDLKGRFLNMGATIYDSFEDSPSANFDLVICSHVLEHTNNPIQFLNSLTRLLKPGGILFIEVPCRDYLYKPVYEPHLLFFDKKSLGNLINKLSYNHLEISYHGPKINESGFTRFKREAYSSILQRLYQLNKNIIQLVIPIDKKKLSIEEAIGLAPYSYLPQSDEPSWWIRAVCIKD